MTERRCRSTSPAAGTPPAHATPSPSAAAGSPGPRGAPAPPHSPGGGRPLGRPPPGFALAGGRRWRVRRFGAGPPVLALHGAGGSGHCWERLTGADIVAVDLPGHGGSDPAPLGRAGLDAVAEDLTELLTALDLAPAAIVGHSAGAAVALRLDMGPVLGLAPALQPFDGLAGLALPGLARGLALNPFAAPMIALTASPGAVRAILAETGSPIDPAPYLALMRDPAHLRGTLEMLAAWDLAPLARRLPQLRSPVALVAGLRDRAIPVAQVREAARRIPGATLTELGTGHLIPEEAPAAVSAALAALLDRAGQPDA